MKRWRMFFLALFAVFCSSAIVLGSSVNSYASSNNSANAFYVEEQTTDFESTSFSGLSSFNGSYVWNNGVNYYYDYSNTHKILNLATRTWSDNSWVNGSDFNGSYVWTDGVNYYLDIGDSSIHRIFDFSTNSLVNYDVQGLSNPRILNGLNVWTDGVNYYFSNYHTGTNSYNYQYVLDVSTSTWSLMTWYGFSNIIGSNVWTDGINIYYSDDSVNYVLDVVSHTWSEKSWSGLSSFHGSDVWTDGFNIYYSYNDIQYVLDVSSSTWVEKSWSGLSSFRGFYVWTDGVNTFYSRNADQYVLFTSLDYVNVSPIGAMTDLITLLTSGIGSMAAGIGSGLSELVSDIFVSNGSLSAFGALITIFAGVALALGLSRWMVNFVCSLGKRNR